MNQNLLLAVLVTRNILSIDDAEKLADHLANKPQSSQLNDALEVVKSVLMPVPVNRDPIPAHVGPEQRAEQEAAQAAPVTVPDNEKTEDELSSQAADSSPGAEASPAATGMDNSVSEPNKATADVSDTHTGGDKDKSTPSKNKKDEKKTTDNSSKK